MNYGDMKKLLEYYVDDVVDTTTTTALFNSGKNKMAIAVHAEFPDITPTAPNDNFVFDARFHEIPVLYAAAMAKSYDSSLQEKNSYLNQYETGLRDFIQNYDPPIQYLRQEYMQHMTVSELLGTTSVAVTNPTYNTRGVVDVYVNSVPVTYTGTATGIDLISPAPLGSVITVVWEPNIYNAPSWMKAW